jgi:hypothetical protein
MTVLPAAPRHQMTELSGVLTFTIPSRKQWLIILFILALLVCWTVIEAMIASILLIGVFHLPIIPGGLTLTPPFEATIFILIWLIVWTLIGTPIWYSWLWHVVGKEDLVVSSEGFSIRRQVFGLGRARVYLVEHIKDLRVTAVSSDPWYRQSHAMQFWNTNSGPITFDYGVQTMYCGDGVDEAEATQIVAEIQRRIPRYRTD